MALKSKWNSDEIMPGLQKQQADKHFCALCLGTLHDSSLREFAKEVPSLRLYLVCIKASLFISK